jgi:hypothetical protein
VRKLSLILIAFLVAICTPWLIASSDINTGYHFLPGGWNYRITHSMVVIHSAQRGPWYFSLKDLFVSAAILILIGLIVLAAIRQRRNAARGFEIQHAADAPIDPGANPSRT